MSIPSGQERGLPLNNSHRKGHLFHAHKVTLSPFVKLGSHQYGPFYVLLGISCPLGQVVMARTLQPAGGAG